MGCGRLRWRFEKGVEFGGRRFYMYETFSALKNIESRISGSLGTKIL